MKGGVNVDRPVINTLGLCAGVGLLDYGVAVALEWLGFQPRSAGLCEWDSYAAAVLLERMEESTLEPCPVWCGDLRDFDATPFLGLVDVLVAGLPCQPYSCAGRQRGWDDHRSYGDGDGPIPQFLRIVSECRPAVVFIENVPLWVTGRWFRPVGEELCRLGYTLESPLFAAAEDVGASHRRERVFIMARLPIVREWRRTARPRNERLGATDIDGGCKDMALSNSAGQQGSGGPGESGPTDEFTGRSERVPLFAPGPASPEWGRILRDAPHLAPAIESGFRQFLDERSVVLDQSRADQLRCIGNACVPLQAGCAFIELFQRMICRTKVGAEAAP